MTPRRWSLLDSLVLAGALVAAAAALFPLLWMVSTSLKPASQVFLLPIQWVPRPPRLGNFAEAATLVPLGRYAANSLVIAAAGVLGTLLSSSLVAYGFARLRAPGLAPLFGLVLATIMLPDTVTIVPSFLIFKQLGWVGTYAPLIVPSWLGGGALGAVYIFVLRQFLLTIPRDQDEAAQLDGAGHLTILWRVLAPQMTPALVAVATFDFLAHWNDFLRPLIYLNDTDMYTLALGISSFKDLYFTQWNLLMAAAVLATVPPVVFLVFGQRAFLHGTVVGTPGAP